MVCGCANGSMCAGLMLCCGSTLQHKHTQEKKKEEKKEDKKEEKKEDKVCSTDMSAAC